MKRTGIFYHQLIGKRHIPLAMGLKDGLQALEKEGIFKEPSVSLIEPEPVSEGLILKVHTKSWIDEVKRSGYYETSLYSLGGLVQASEKVLEGEIDNALVFVGVGGHHAHRDHAWGGCYFNLIAVAIESIRGRFGAHRFAVIDTDSHHANGTIEIYQSDEEVLYICFCEYGTLTGKTKVCLPQADSDEEFVQRISREIPWRISEFKPDLVYWVCGLDTHRDSYGTGKLTERCYPEQAKLIKEVADKFCRGKLVMRLICNAPPYVCEYVAPKLVNCFAELNKLP